MGVKDDVFARSRRRPGPSCTLRLALDAMPPGDADEYRELIWDPEYRRRRITNVSIAQDLNTRHGTAISDQMIARHRQNLCAGCTDDYAAFQATL